MSTRRLLAESLAPIVNLVYPPRCPACGEGLGEQAGLCIDCWSDLVIPADPACVLCQRPFGEHGPDAGATCAACMADPPLHDGIAAGALYNDTSRKLILSFKHGRRIAMAPMLARQIAARMPAPSPDRLLVPVPLHRWRLWQRGYNQSALLARELAKLGHGEVAVDLLVRRKPTPSLGGMGAKARLRALAGAIDVARPRKAKDRHCVLVDDVLTSGATSTACVKSLKRAGAKTVVVACFARVLDEAIEPARQSDI